MAHKWYVVWEGHEPGVYETWAECEQKIMGYKGAKYKSFSSQSAALRAYEDGYYQYKKQNPENLSSGGRPIVQALAVDAACSGNPGIMEYRGVMTDTHREVFRVLFPEGTNNIGEFLAIVHGISLLKKHNLDIPIYSDSVTGIAWVRNKRCKTLLARNERTAVLLDTVARAEKWLLENTYSTKVYKWDTESWGEIPADFGRK